MRGQRRRSQETALHALRMTVWRGRGRDGGLEVEVGEELGVDG